MITKDTNPKDAVGDKKTPLWLLSPIAKAAWAVAHFAGVLKYGAWNWRAAGVRTSVYLSAIERHLDAYKSGEEHDPVDGSHHLGNIMACAAILLDAKAAGKLTDDRPPSVDVRPAYAEAEAAMAKLREQYADKSPRHYTIADTEGAAPRLAIGTRVLVSHVDEDDIRGPVSGCRGEVIDNDGSDYNPWYVQLDDGRRVYFEADELEVLP